MTLKKKFLFLTLILSIIFLAGQAFSETDEEKLDRFQGYHDTTYNIFILLTGIFFLLVVVAMILIVNYFGIKHLWNYIWIAGAFGGVFLIMILFKFL